LSGAGENIDTLQLVDLDGDGRLELVIGYAVEPYLGLQNNVRIYRLSEHNILQEVMNEPYSKLAVGDLDQDGRLELTLFTLDRAAETAYATAYRFVDGKAVIVDRLPMDWTVNGYITAFVGKASGHMNGLFAAVGVGAHSSYSILLVLQNDKLRDVFRTTQGDGVDTMSAYGREPDDANGDGIVEIPILIEASKDASYANMGWITAWHQWDGKDGLKEALRNFYDYEAGFRFDIPESWYHGIEIVRETRSITFYSTDANQTVRDPLVAIDYYTEEEWLLKEKEWKADRVDYVVLGRNLGWVIAGRWPDSSKSPQFNDRTNAKARTITHDELLRRVKMLKT